MCSGNGVNETEIELVSGRKMNLVQDMWSLRDVYVESIIYKD